MEPLGLPRGSVRAALSFIIIVAFIASCFLDVSSNEARIALSGLSGVVITYYFRQREAESEQAKS